MNKYFTCLLIYILHNLLEFHSSPYDRSFFSEFLLLHPTECTACILLELSHYLLKLNSNKLFSRTIRENLLRTISERYAIEEARS
jgi:hypothetical protein